MCEWKDIGRCTYDELRLLDVTLWSTWWVLEHIFEKWVTSRLQFWIQAKDDKWCVLHEEVMSSDIFSLDDLRVDPLPFDKRVYPSSHISVSFDDVSDSLMYTDTFYLRRGDYYQYPQIASKVGMKIYDEKKISVYSDIVLYPVKNIIIDWDSFPKTWSYNIELQLLDFHENPIWWGYTTSYSYYSPTKEDYILLENIAPIMKEYVMQMWDKEVFENENMTLIENVFVEWTRKYYLAKNINSLFTSMLMDYRLWDTEFASVFMDAFDFLDESDFDRWNILTDDKDSSNNSDWCEFPAWTVIHLNSNGVSIEYPEIIGSS